MIRDCRSPDRVGETLDSPDSSGLSRSLRVPLRYKLLPHSWQEGDQVR